jgi:hypothetical protein
MSTRRGRTIAGRVVEVAGSRLRVRLWHDPDTVEDLDVEAPLAPAPGLDSTAYVTVTDDGSVIVGEPYSSPGRGVWRYAGTDVSVDPGPGNIAIQGSGNSPRVFAVSAVDADGFTRNLSLIAAGDNLTITDDPAAPPTTGFARYVVLASPTDNGTYYVAGANRTDTNGSQTPPPIGTRLRVSFATAGGGAAGGPFVVRFDTYQDLTDGITIGG